ncbi:IclR family transcriptional regulator [Pseudonocardia sp. CA-107938]|uniref:IclR family transcriptional regulator n=1 Tax=Pseudonocardia sp. CA-107938 TaxID=3240021 RepID=UPI003D8CE2DD
MPRLVPAVVRAFDVLELFLGDQVELTAQEIAERSGIPRSSLHELLTTLVARGYLDRSTGAGGGFRLGPRLLELGSRYKDRLDLGSAAEAVARVVAAECDETVQVGVLDGPDVVYIAKIDSTHGVRLISAVGRRLPAHCTAIGKVLLAQLSDAAFDELLPPELPALTRNSITSREVLREQLREVRRDGVAHERSESNLDAGCVAAPVVDEAGRWIAAMSITVPTSRQTPEGWTGWTALVRRGAAELSRRLGATG